MQCLPKFSQYIEITTILYPHYCYFLILLHVCFLVKSNRISTISKKKRKKAKKERYNGVFLNAITVPTVIFLK
ncbi:hypothetical protein ACSBR2_013253 [Camellia fascicularis]